MKVAKFGGSSLADGAKIQHICKIVANDPDRRIVVVSAPGKRTPDDTKVTDLLIACGEAQLKRGEAEAELEAVVERFREVQRDLELPESVVETIEKDLRERLAMDASDPNGFLDCLKAGGEDNCAKIVAQALRNLGQDAEYVNPGEAGLLLSDEYGNARVLDESYEKLRKLRERDGVVVFPGFFGYTKSGAVATFPRGGSDITGAILAAAVAADLYENFTDVDSVFSADPRIVEEARPVREITYLEMRELSYAGFGVFHDEAVLPAIRARIPICIRNTSQPEGPGTMILPRRQNVPGEVAGIAGMKGFCTIFIEKYLMNRMIGFVSRLLRILEEEGIPFEHLPSGIDNVSLILESSAIANDKEHRLLERIRRELEPDDVRVERGLALLMIVGEGMRHTVGVAGCACSALAKAGVNIEMINQGSSEISMMFGVKEEDRATAVQALYDAFFL